jgi:phosphoglycolate phosphatase-like HAD superfamily hydrolase
MVGDSPADMMFGKKLGMKTVLIGDEVLDDPALTDARFISLAGFARSLK